MDSAIVDDAGLNNPTAVSGASLVPSKTGNGLTLAPGGYVDIADNGTLDNQTFTTAAWVRPMGPDTNNDGFGGVILSKNVNDLVSSLELGWSASAGRFNLFCDSTLVSSKDTFAAGPFYHVAATYDGTTLSLYVNGVLEGQQTGIGSVVYDATDPWTIGSEGPQFRPDLSRTFNGVIDDVDFYNRALSATEIQSIVAAAPANAPPSANAGGPYVIAAGSSVTLNASASSDPENDPLTYSWTINGHTGAATGVQPTLSWSALQALGVSANQSYQVSVSVDDGQGHTVTSPNVVLWVASQLPALPVTSGLVSSYSFDSAIVDDVGLNNPSAVGGATLVPGKAGNGLSLAPGGYVDIADDGTLDNQTFTVSAWVEPGDNFANSVGGAIINKDLTEVSQSVGLYYFSTTHQFYFYNNSPDGPIVSAHTFAPGSYYQVAVSYDGTTFQLYVNGVLEGHSDVARSLIYDPTIPWTIGSSNPGARNAGYPWTWNGVIDEVHFYDRGLSAAEIEALAGQTKTVLTSSTNPSLLNQPVTFTATVSSSSGTPTGSVDFVDTTTGTDLGTVALSSSGTASVTVSNLAVGSHAIEAVYAGQGFYLGSSGTLTQQVDYQFSGFLPPLSNGLAFAANRTIAIKFQLTDYNGAYISSLNAVTSLKVLNSSGVDVLAGAGTTGLLYDSTSNQFIYNWQTHGLPAGTYSIQLVLADGTKHTTTVSLTAAGNSAGLVTDGSGGTATAGALLGGEVDLYVDNSNGELTSDELARIDDAVNAIDATIAPYGVTIVELADPTQANVTLNMNTTSLLGGYAQGVLGCTTDADQVTMIQGWNWYAGSDATQIGAGQYDFETAVMHELGHVLGLGHSSASTSVMYSMLATGTANRTLAAADLNVPDDSGTCALHAVPTAAVSGPSNGQGMTAPISTSIPLGGLMPPAQSGNPLSAVDQALANFALLLSNATNTYQSELTSISALWQSVDALALQRLDALPYMEAGAMGVTKDILMRDFLFAKMSSPNG